MFEELYKKMKAVGASAGTKADKDFKGQVDESRWGKDLNEYLARVEASLRDRLQNTLDTSPSRVFGDRSYTPEQKEAVYAAVQSMMSKVVDGLTMSGTEESEPEPELEPDAEKSGYKGGGPFSGKSTRREQPRQAGKGETGYKGGGPFSREPEPGVDRRDFLTSADRRRNRRGA